MKKILFILLLGLCHHSVAFSQSQRNFLTNKYSEKEIESNLVKGNDWIKYPDYENRTAWKQIPEEIRKQFIKRGETYLGYNWPGILATQYLEFTRSGNRQVMERVYNERRSALVSLAMAELVEGQGRFLDDLINGVFSFCEQTYWGYSAHFYMYAEGRSPGDGNPLTNLPDINNPIIDLGVGEVAADLSWIYHFFNKKFYQISPILSQRLHDELYDKVLTPFYERMDYWWITGWGKGQVNNWTPWCNYNVLNAVLLMEKNQAVKAKAIYKTMKSVDLFYNAYPDDGACDEGPSYWGAAGARAFEYLELLNIATNGYVNIFNEQLIRNIGTYIYKVYIAQGCYFTNFSDAPAKIVQRGSGIYRYGDKIEDTVMKQFGAYLLHQQSFDRKAPGGSMAQVLKDLFELKGWQETEPLEPLIKDYYFPDMQIAIARNQEGSNQGFYFAAKGGTNGEGHNHNDVGNAIIFYNGYPVFVDAGVGTYTAQTFSPERYKIWTMSSYFHNVPYINGNVQSPGRKFAAKNVHFESNSSKAIFRADISGAYSTEANVKNWTREYCLLRKKNKLIISDEFSLAKHTGATELHLLTPLNCRVIGNDKIFLYGENVNLELKFDSKLCKVSIEPKPIADVKLKKVWGDSLYLLRFTISKKNLGENSLEIYSAY